MVVPTMWNNKIHHIIRETSLDFTEKTHYAIFQF